MGFGVRFTGMAKLTVTVKDVDRGWKAMLKSLVSIQKSEVRVGYFSDKDNARPDGLSNVDLAAIHEFGAPSRGIPERSFIRSTVDANRDAYVNFLKKALNSAMAGERGPAWAFEVLGQKVVADIRNRVTQGAGIPPPNSPKTVALKGSSRPLVDSGLMLKALTYAVVGVKK